MQNKIIQFMIKILLIAFQFVGLYLLMRIGNKKTSTFLIVFGMFLALNLTKNMYSFKSYLFWEEMKRQFIVHVEIGAIIVLIDIVEKQNIDIIVGLIGSGIYFVYNIILSKMIRKIFYKHLKKNLLIVGTGITAKYMAETVKNNRFTIYDLHGFLDIKKLRKKYTDKMSIEERKVEVEKRMVLGEFHNLEKILEGNQIDEVIIALPNATKAEMIDLIEILEGKVDKVKFTPKLNSTFTFNSKVEDYDGMLLISSTTGKMTKLQKGLKRSVDIIAGITGIVILTPLTIIVWLKTEKEERKNGLFFNQNRIGLNGNLVKIYKYRSMITGAEEVLEELMEKDPDIKKEYLTNKKLKNDPRITKVGEKLRKTSLDEFPQFINVLKGNMSLIGPRPYLPREIEDMGSYYGSIIKSKPGITGMWQSHGRSDTTFDVRLEFDRYYSRNWSLWLDIVILIKTFKQVLGREGNAY